MAQFLKVKNASFVIKDLGHKKTQTYIWKAWMDLKNTIDAQLYPGSIKTKSLGCRG